jgi:uncharacterized iron-regulated protein
MVTSKRTHLLFLVALLVLLLSACAPEVKRMGNPEEPYSPPHPPKVGEILHLPTGLYVSQQQMLEIATRARIVYVGETHDNPASHREELAVLRALADRYPGRVALGMEMFTPDQQKALDRWVAGKLTEKEFLKESHWYRTWGMDFAYYKAILDFARQQKIPVIGLNADKHLVHALMKSDVAHLPEKERKQVPQMDLTDPYQRAMVDATFAGHEHGSGDLAAFERVQTLWDETMAHNVAAYLKSPAGKDRHMMVMAGGNHIQYGFGIPRRVFRRLPTSYVLIGSREIVIPKDMQNRLMDIHPPQFPMVPYDFVEFTRYEKLPGHKVHLGVYLGKKGGAVVLEGVLPGSSAAAAGLKKGDRLLSMDGAPIKDEFDVIYAVSQKHPGDHSTLVIERNGHKKTVEVTFKKMPPHHGKPKR